jgi:methyl coenzyme M reductase alpha subunit
MRDLKTGEFNRVYIRNTDEVLRVFRNYREGYRTPYEILADLEKTIRTLNEFPTTVMIDYKFDGYALFDKVWVGEKDGYRVVVYEYATTVS